MSKIALSLILSILAFSVLPVQIQAITIGEAEIIWESRAIIYSDSYNRSWSGLGFNQWDWIHEVWINNTKYNAIFQENSTWYHIDNQTHHSSMVMIDLDRSLMNLVAQTNLELPLDAPPSQEFWDILFEGMNGDEMAIEFSIVEMRSYSEWNWNQEISWYDENMSTIEKPNLTNTHYEWMNETHSDTGNNTNIWFSWYLSQHIPLTRSTRDIMYNQDIRWRDISLCLYNDTNGNNYPDITLGIQEWGDNETSPLLQTNEMLYIFMANEANITKIDPIVSNNSIIFSANFDLKGNWYSMDTNIIYQYVEESQNVTEATISDYQINFTIFRESDSIRVKQNVGIQEISALPEENLSLTFLQSLEIAEIALNYNMQTDQSTGVQSDTSESVESNCFDIYFNNNVMQRVSLDMQGEKYQLGNQEYDLIGTQLPVASFQNFYTGIGNGIIENSTGEMFLIGINIPIYNKSLPLSFDPQLITTFGLADIRNLVTVIVYAGLLIGVFILVVQIYYKYIRIRYK